MKNNNKIFVSWLLTLLVYVMPCNSSLALTESQGKIFISNKFKGGIYIFDENSLEQIKVILPNVTSAEMMISTKESIYLIEPSTITVLNNNLSEIADYDFDANPMPGAGKAVLSPDQKKLYIGVIGWGKAEVSGVFVIDLDKGETLKIFKNQYMHTGFIEVSEDGNHLYVPENLNIIHIRNCSDFKTYKKIILDKGDNIREIMKWGEKEIIVVVNSDTHIEENEKQAHYRCEKISIPSGSRKKLLLPSKIYRIMAGPDKKVLYVLGEKTITKIDADHFLIINTKPVDGNNMAISSDGKRLYILSSLNNQLIVWDIAEDKIVKTINIGEEPYEIMVKKSN